MTDKTVIFGASNNPDRVSYIAAQRLSAKGMPFVPVGIRKGEIFGEPILDPRQKPQIDQVHTITLYMNPQRQVEWYDYLLSLKPERIIFNPGAENKELAQRASEQGIEVAFACTLVMLASGSY
jgi:hypothetical protein